MSRKKNPVTPAVRLLRKAGVEFIEHPYRYIPEGGTAAFASEAGVDEHLVVKTLIMENERSQPLVVLMHGDREVSTKELARQIGSKVIRPCDRNTAERYTGYKIGGTSPFGTRRKMPVFCEGKILELPRVYINGGARGFLVSLSPSDLARILEPTLVSVAR